MYQGYFIFIDPMCQDQIHNKLLLQNTDSKLALSNLSMSGEAFSSKLLVLFLLQSRTVQDSLFLLFVAFVGGQSLTDISMV